MAKKYDYDAIIIGAGISGLVCGCYLAKAGLKTLIVEQGKMPGGYCTSFSRKGYLFDTAVHYIGGIQKGSLATVFKDLEIKNEFKFSQMDPADKIIIPGHTTYIRANPYNTIEEFKKSFPSERGNIVKFFSFIMQTNLTSVYRKVVGTTFDDLLDSFFKSKKLKNTIGVLLLGNMGLPPSRISAFASVIFFKEFLLDPGYYPSGGMQQFANYLSKKFKRYGGELLLATKVSKIIIKNNNAQGVNFLEGKKLKSKVVISGIDATQTFKHLIREKTKEARTVSKLQPSNSVYAAYLGIKINLKRILNDVCNIWYVTTDDLEGSYKNLSKNIKKRKIPLIMLSFPSQKDSFLKNQSKETLQIFTMATYENRNFWIKNRISIKETIIKLAKDVIPQLEKHIDLIETATPFTYYGYTLNRNGAAFGWASTPEQMKTTLLPQNTSVKNLFLVGHWSISGTGQGGISTVALSGQKLAKRLINLTKSI